MDLIVPLEYEIGHAGGRIDGKIWLPVKATRELAWQEHACDVSNRSRLGCRSFRSEEYVAVVNAFGSQALMLPTRLVPDWLCSTATSSGGRWISANLAVPDLFPERSLRNRYVDCLC